ncbi:uncharacterized protein J3R85_020889 [Psidium guajava]|nr:uncharacterized protein J3R85_020889 [Psidium guajava]
MESKKLLEAVQNGDVSALWSSTRSSSSASPRRPSTWPLCLATPTSSRSCLAAPQGSPPSWTPGATRRST